MLGIRDDISLKVTDRSVGNLVLELKNLRIGFSQLSCSEKLCKEEADKQKKKVNTTVEKTSLILMK